MADLSEVWKVLCDTIVADATIVGLLGAPTGCVIYSEDKIAKLPAYPFLRLMVVSAASNKFDSGLGRWDLSLQIDVIGPGKAVNWRLAGLLEELLDIPRARPAGLSTTSYKITEMTLDGPVAPVGDIGIRDATGQEIKQLATTWSMRICRI